MEKLFVKNQANVKVVVDDNNVFVQALVLGGSIVEPLKASAQNSTITLRSVSVDNNNVVKNDVVFKNLTALASFVAGANVNAKSYLKSVYLWLDSLTISSTQENVQVSTQESVQESVQTEEVKVNNGVMLCTRKEAVEKIVEYYNKLDNLLKEVNYKVYDTGLLNERTFNTILNCKTIKDAQEQARSFILLSGGMDEQADKVVSLLNSKESKQDFENIKAFLQDNNVALKQENKRFYIYFGEAGSGKTTKAMLENKDADILIASSDFVGSNLFSNFNVENKRFEKNLLCKSIEDGKTLIIDEINLFADDVLTRLQGVLDNKPTFYEDNLKERITIGDGFKVIATMNLTRSLPVALVSRAICKEFKLTAKDIAERMLSF